MKKNLMYGTTILVALVLISTAVDAQILKTVANKFATEATGARSSAELAVKAVGGICMVAGFGGAMYKIFMDKQEGSQAFGGWVMKVIVVGIGLLLIGVVGF